MVKTSDQNNNATLVVDISEIVDPKPEDLQILFGKLGMVHSWWKPLFNAWTDGLDYVRLVAAILVKNRWLLESHLVGGLEHVFMFPYIGNNHPNWLSHIFQKGWNHQPAITWFRYWTCRHFTCLKQSIAFPVQLNTRDQPANMSLKLVWIDHNIILYIYIIIYYIYMLYIIYLYIIFYVYIYILFYLLHYIILTYIILYYIALYYIILFYIIILFILYILLCIILYIYYIYIIYILFIILYTI